MTVIMLLWLIAAQPHKPVPGGYYDLGIKGKRARIESVDSRPVLKLAAFDSDEVWLEYPRAAAVSKTPERLAARDDLDIEMEWKVDGPSLRWLFTFSGKPASNTYTLRLGGAWQAYDWFYQVPFADPVEIEVDGEPWLRQYEGSRGDYSERPVAVDGSYAVYHKTKRDNQYKTGKAFHVLRPKATDTRGVTAWCGLAIDSHTGIYRVTIPPAFLAAAAWPVTINDTFGYTTGGSTGYNSVSSGEHVALSLGTASASGTVTDLYLYDSDYSTSAETRLAVYEDDAPTDLLWESAGLGSGDFDGGGGWLTYAISGGPSIASGTAYCVGVQEAGSSDLRVQYDTVAGYVAYKVYSAYGAFVDPYGTPDETYSDRRSSVYLVYTPEGADSYYQVIIIAAIPILITGLAIRRKPRRKAA